jgi:putative sterol carrier protein
VIAVAIRVGYNHFMSIETVTEQIRKKIALAPDIKAAVLFDFGDDGVIYIDGTQSPPAISHDAPDSADVTLITSLETFTGIVNGTQDPNIAFMMGKLKVKGNMGLAMKLNSILED